ncbi:MAG: pilus assembly protein PilM [Desulfuromonadales bacterium]
MNNYLIKNARIVNNGITILGFVMVRGGIIRAVAEGEPGVDQDLAEVMNDATESLTQEIQRSLDFFSATSSDEMVQKVFITGGVSMVPAVKTSLEHRLGVAVEIIDPWRNIAWSDKEFDAEYLQAMGPVFTVAAGLAMRRMGDK